MAGVLQRSITVSMFPVGKGGSSGRERTQRTNFSAQNARHKHDERTFPPQQNAQMPKPFMKVVGVASFGRRLLERFFQFLFRVVVPVPVPVPVRASEVRVSTSNVLLGRSLKTAST